MPKPRGTPRRLAESRADVVRTTGSQHHRHQPAIAVGRAARRAALVAGSALLLAACTEEPTGPTEQSEAHDLVALPPLPSPDPQLVFAQAVPGFGGLFLDDADVPTVYLKDAGQSRVALAAVSSQLRALGVDPARLRVLPADYDYLQLSRWTTAAFDEVAAATDVVSFDVDEARNRISIGVLSEAGRETVVRALARLGLPAEAVHVELTEPVHFAATLRDRSRPVVGGLQISSAAGTCTLGFNVGLAVYGNTRDHRRSFVTNSHCTERRSVVEGTRFFQGSMTTTNLIGTEVADPKYFLCIPGTNYHCRYSDAARAVYTTTTAFDLGAIARTSWRSSTAGSLTLNGTFRITAESANQLQGMTANKVGRSTGWTYGKIRSTCANRKVANSNIYLLCQSLVDAGVAAGDSGSPVFGYTGSGNVTLYGLLWGSNSSGTRFVYSPMSGIERELGRLTTF